MKHVMVDIETLGTGSNKVITSIAAIAFNPNTGEEYNQMMVNIDIDSCLKAGLKVDGSTIRFWLKQEDKARMLLAEPIDPKSLVDALHMFTSFINLFKTNEGFMIWGNSARFDEGLIEDAYKAIDIEKPWDHKYEMCLRTIASLRPEVKKRILKEFDHLVKHDPINDCRKQIKYLVPIWNEIMPQIS